MPIDARLKALIQTHNVAPSTEQEKNDIHYWMQAKWVPFFLTLFNDDLLYASYKNILNAKIDSHEQTATRFMYLRNDFLADIFVECNNEYQWFDQQKHFRVSLLPSFISSEIDEYRSEHDGDQKEHPTLKDKLWEFHQQASLEWYQDKLQGFDAREKETYYKKALETFLEALKLEFFELEDNCRTWFKEHLEAMVRIEADSLKFIQNNHEALCENFVRFAQENPSLGMTSLLEDKELLIKLIASMQETVNAHEELNTSFSNALCAILNHGKLDAFKDKQLIISLNKTDDFCFSYHTVLPELVIKGVFSAITIYNAKDTVVFSYTRESGVLINAGFLKSEEVSQVEIANDTRNDSVFLAAVEQKSANKFFVPGEKKQSKEIAEYFKKQVNQFVLEDQEIYAYNEKLPFYQYGKSGIRAYLDTLDKNFAYRLRKNLIEKGYTLLLPSDTLNNNTPCIDINIIKGIYAFLKEQLEAVPDYVFSCQRIMLSLNITANDDGYIEAIGQLIEALNQAKVTECCFNINHLESHQLSVLSAALQGVHHTTIRFNILDSVEQALTLEAINDNAKQLSVPYYHFDDKEKIVRKEEIVDQPQPVTRARIKLLMDEVVELKPVESKIGIQNQHQYSEGVQQQTEVAIQQSWQVTENTQTQHKNYSGYMSMSSDEKNSLILWQDIEAAFDPTSSLYEESRKKIGEEILQYHYKGRDLKDLWQRLTGNLEVTQQHVVEKVDPDFEKYRYFSLHIPKQISQKALLSIVRHPHLFQDGVHLQSLPEPMSFDWRNGALYVADKKVTEKADDRPNPFAVRLQKVPSQYLPSSQYVNYLLKSAIPSKGFYQQLLNSMPAYEAWHGWQRAFASLNLFNASGIAEINTIVQKCVQEVTQEKLTILFNYVIEALNYYVYLRLARQQIKVQKNKVQFEEQEQAGYKKGELHQLSYDIMNQLPSDLRQTLHQALVDTLNNADYVHHDPMSEDEYEAYKQCILSLIAHHARQLPVRLTTEFNEENVLQLLPHIGHKNITKLLELMTANHHSVAYSFVSMLLEIKRVFGEVGLTDFTDCFLTSAINIALLTTPIQQQALVQLLQLTPTQYHWWQQLTKQHAAQSGYLDFAVAMTAFQHFLAELKELKIDGELSMPCPLQGINNLQVCLDRVICLLKTVKKPAEQIRNLSGLDFGAAGVTYAAQKADYQFISADMKLNAEGESLLRLVTNQYSYSSSSLFAHHHAKPFDRYKLTENYLSEASKYVISLAAITCFYRYIGSQKYAAPMSVYKQLLDHVSLPKTYSIIEPIMGVWRVDGKLATKPTCLPNYDNIILANLLPIIAYTMTGERGLDSLPKQEERRIKELNEFIRAAYECAREQSSDNDLQQLLDNSNAVSSKGIIDLLENCADLCKPVGRYETHQNRVRLTLPELTRVLTWINRANRESWKEVRLREKTEGTAKNNFNSGDILKEVAEIHEYYNRDVFGQLRHTVSIVEKYDPYIIEAFNRIRFYNDNTDYACFIAVCCSLEKHPFSFENKGRLLRVISLVYFDKNTFFVDAHCVNDFLKRLTCYQEKAGMTALDEFLSVLSAVVPQKNNPFSIDQLQLILNACLIKAEHQESIDVKSFVLSQLPECQIDPNVEEVKDTDFYQSALTLEQQFKGLGHFYKQLKSIMLQRYPASFGENKQKIWQDFLTLIKKLKNTAQQEQVLQMLLSAKLSRLDLNSLTPWLTVLFNQDKKEHGCDFHPAYFNALTVTLMKHPHKNVYINLLSKWWTHANSFSVQDNSGLIAILGKLIDVSHDEKFLQGDVFDCLFNLALLSRYDQYPWYQHVITLLDVLYSKGLTEQYIKKIFTSLKRLTDSYFDKESSCYYSGRFKQALLFWLSNIHHNLDLMLAFTEHFNEKNINKTSDQLLILGQLPTLNLQTAYQFIKTMSDDQLTQLAQLYNVQPIPAEPLFVKLMQGDITLDVLIAEHIRDPHHERNTIKLQQQFDDNALLPYINRAKLLNGEGKSTLIFADKLSAQSKFVNHIGLIEHRHFSLQEIRDAMQHCRAVFAKASTDAEKLTVSLTAFSLIREAIYKTSKLWPSAVQTLAVLSMLNHQLQGNTVTPLFMQMATGEGKSLLAVFLALLTWLQGKPVTVVTHRASLAVRDVKAFQSLFESLGIECAHLTADNYSYRLGLINLKNIFNEQHNKPEFDGVYYADFNDIALIRQKRLLDIGKDINEMSFILDEADESMLHNHTDNNLTQTVGGADMHPHAWVFQALAAYLDNINSKKPPMTVRISELVAFLCMTYPRATDVCQNPDFLSMLPTYLQAAWLARTLKEKFDFIPKKLPDSDEYYASVLINDKPMPPNVTFHGLIQQALHGRLNHEAVLKQSTQHFKVAPESLLYSSMSPESVLHWMKKCGSLIALSATIGSNAERMELQQQYGFSYIKLPKMQSTLRTDYPVQFCQNQEQQLKAIVDICQYYTKARSLSKARAVLVVVDSIDLAEKTRKFLSDNLPSSNISMLHAGLDELSDETLSQIERQAGQKDQVLIAMSGLISRGFDIKLSSAKQLVVISTYLKNGIDEVQVKGRGSRVNQKTSMRDKGKFYAVYDLEAELKRYPGFVNKIDDIDLNPQAFTERQYFANYTQEAAMRLHRKLKGAGKTIIQNHFYGLWTALCENKLVLKTMRDNVMNLFTKTLEEMVNIVPAADFSMSSEKSITARHEYNLALFKRYTDFLKQLPSILSVHALDDIDNIIENLLSETEAAQQQMVDDNKNALSVGADSPDVKVYHQWKKGVKYNAYLSAGKQGFSDYLYNTLSSYALSKERIKNIEEGKEQLRQILEEKQLKKSDFLSQLKEFEGNNTIHQKTYNDIFVIYESHKNSSDVKKIDHGDNIGQYVPQYSDISLINHEYVRGQVISFIHDPLVGKACQIQLVGNDFGVFKRLQDALNYAYRECHIKQRIQCKVTKDHLGYSVILDFSGRQFDLIDRKKLFDIIGDYFRVSASCLFNRINKPSLDMMKQMVALIQDKLRSAMVNIPDDVQHCFTRMPVYNTRKHYHGIIFEPLLTALKKHYAQLSYEMQNITEALINCGRVINYYNIDGKLCHSYPSLFERIEELVESDKKRQAIAILNQHIIAINQSSFCDTLLCQYQKDALINLSNQLISASMHESLFAIYDQWCKSTIHYKQNAITVSELMRAQDFSSLMFFAVARSPDLSGLHQQLIQVIGNPMNVQNAVFGVESPLKSA